MAVSIGEFLTVRCLKLYARVDIFYFILSFSLNYVAIAHVVQTGSVFQMGLRFS